MSEYFCSGQANACWYQRMGILNSSDARTCLQVILINAEPQSAFHTELSGFLSHLHVYDISLTNGTLHVNTFSTRPSYGSYHATTSTTRRSRARSLHCVQRHAPRIPL